MPELRIPVQSISRCGLPPEYYMAMRLEAAGAPLEIKGLKVKRTGEIKEMTDPEKKHIIFMWEDEK